MAKLNIKNYRQYIEVHNLGNNPHLSFLVDWVSHKAYDKHNLNPLICPNHNTKQLVFKFDPDINGLWCSICETFYIKPSYEKLEDIVKKED